MCFTIYFYNMFLLFNVYVHYKTGQKWKHPSMVHRPLLFCPFFLGPRHCHWNNLILLACTNHKKLLEKTDISCYLVWTNARFIPQLFCDNWQSIIIHWILDRFYVCSASFDVAWGEFEFTWIQLKIKIEIWFMSMNFYIVR